MTDAEVEEKFRRLAGRLLSKDKLKGAGPDLEIGEGEVDGEILNLLKVRGRDDLSRQTAPADHRKAHPSPAGAFNAFSAELIERAGFEAVYISGAGLANGVAGFPTSGFSLWRR